METFNILMLGRLLAAILRQDNDKALAWLKTLSKSQAQALNTAAHTLVHLTQNFL